MCLVAVYNASNSVQCWVSGGREDSSIVTLSVASPGPVMTASVSTGTNTTQPGLSMEQPPALVKLCPVELETKVNPKVRNHGE